MTSTSTAMALRTHCALAAMRTLDELDDDDALAIGVAFKRSSTPVLISLVGVGAAVALGAVTLGTVSAFVICGVGAVMTATAAWRGSRTKLRIELGISAHDAKRLTHAGIWHTHRMREPSTDDELRAHGRFMIDKARGR